MANCLDCKHCTKQEALNSDYVCYGCSKDMLIVFDPYAKKDCIEIELVDLFETERNVK